MAKEEGRVESKNSVPNPGTEDALALGCKCPVAENGHGKGWIGWRGGDGKFAYRWDCPVHRIATIKDVLINNG